MANGDITKMLQESVPISNIKIILLAKPFLAPQMQVALRAYICPRQASSHSDQFSVLDSNDRFLICCKIHILGGEI